MNLDLALGRRLYRLSCKLYPSAGTMTLMQVRMSGTRFRVAPLTSGLSTVFELPLRYLLFVARGEARFLARRFGKIGQEGECWHEESSRGLENRDIDIDTRGRVASADVRRVTHRVEAHIE